MNANFNNEDGRDNGHGQTRLTTAAYKYPAENTSLTAEQINGISYTLDLPTYELGVRNPKQLSSVTVE